MDKETKWLEEFKEAATFHRLQNTLLLGQVTIFLAANAGLLAIFSKESSPGGIFAVGLKIGGVFLAISMWAISDRAYQYSYAARLRAGKLSEKLCFEIYNNLEIPKPSLMPATIAMKCLYIFGGIGWLVSLILL